MESSSITFGWEIMLLAEWIIMKLMYHSYTRLLGVYYDVGPLQVLGDWFISKFVLSKLLIFILMF